MTNTPHILNPRCWALALGAVIDLTREAWDEIRRNW